MSDFDRNLADRNFADRNVAGFSGTMTQAETAAIDAGLRSYMLRVYNFMMIGLAITGFAALGIYLLSVTDTVDGAASFRSRPASWCRVAATCCSPASATRCSSAR
jgi:FtsH-binding integral membrane protein